MKFTSGSMIKFSLDYLMIFLLFSGIIGGSFIWHLIIIGVFTCLLFTTYTPHKANLTVFIFLALIVILFLLSVMKSDGLSAISTNVRSSLYSLCTIGICHIANERDSTFLEVYLEKHIKLLNGLLLINIIVLAIQSQETGFLIRSSWLEQNPYYADHCAGLFGRNATNQLGMFSLFVMLLNFFHAERIKIRARRHIFLIYTLGTQVIMAYLSQYNDNIAFYMMLFMFLGIYAAATIFKTKDCQHKFYKVVMYILLLAAGFFILLNIPVLGDYIKTTVELRFRRMFFYESMGYAASGSNERMAIIKYAFQNGTTYFAGTGVGDTMWMQPGAFGFQHFGINSASSYLVITGLWFYIVYTLFYTHLIYKIINKGKKKSKFLYFCTLIMVIFFTVYTTLYNDARSVLIVVLISVCIKKLLEGTTFYGKGR